MRSLYFIGLKFYQQLFLTREGKKLFAVSLQNRKSCVCIKYLTLVWPRKLIAVNFTSIAKKLFISQFFKQIKLCLCLFLHKKIISPQKMFMSCLCSHHGAYLNSASNVFAYLLIIFLGHDWLGFFLNKWGCIISTP